MAEVLEVLLEVEAVGVDVEAEAFWVRAESGRRTRGPWWLM